MIEGALQGQQYVYTTMRKRVTGVPLSEDEQRVLRDIERNFYESDPAFAQAVTDAVVYRHAKRNAKLGVAGFIVSLALLLATFTQAPLIGFVGFLGMVGCAFVAVQNVRRVGTVAAAGRDNAGRDNSVKHGQSINDLRDRFRRRFG